MGSNSPPYPLQNPYQESILNTPPPQINDSQSFSPAVIAVIGVLGAAFLLVSYYTIVAKFCTLQRARRRNSGALDDDNEAVWPIFTQGLQAPVIQSIAVCKFSKDEGLVDGSECAVCLSEFEEGESLRLLPKCSHAFHLPCIDKWLQTHSNCPLCRANIVSPRPFFVPVFGAPLPTIATGNDGNAAQIGQSLQDAGNSVQDRSDQRSSGRRVEDHRSPHGSLRFGSESNMQGEGGEVVDAKKRLKPVNSGQLGAAGKRFPSSLADLRCSSASHLLNMGKKERMQSEGSGHGAATSSMMKMRRSFSVGSFCKGLEQPFHKLEDLQLGMFYGNKIHQDLHLGISCNQEAEDDETRTINLAVNLETPGSSSIASRDFKSRSMDHEATFKSNKSDQLMTADPLMERMLLSLKGPLAVKRSFSGGRLFGFKLKSTESTRLPI